MDYNNKIHQREKYLAALLPIAKYKISKKTNSVLYFSTYKLHFYFLRFVFAFFSFILYVPSIVEEFNNSDTIITYTRLIIAVSVLIFIEIRLSLSLQSYYESYYSLNDIPTNKKAVIFLAALSIALSSLSGINVVEITDKTAETAITASKTDNEKNFKAYSDLIAQNNAIINTNSELIKSNNDLIISLKKIAATKKGSRQIAEYMRQNADLSNQNKSLIENNINIRNDINNLNSKSDLMLNKQLIKADNKELIWMIIFFFLGVFSVVGLISSYKFIGRYYYWLTIDNENSEKKKPDNDGSLTTATSRSLDTSMHAISTENEASGQNATTTGKKPATTRSIYAFSDLDYQIIEKIKLPEHKYYIFREARELFGHPITEIKIAEMGLNAFTRHIIGLYPLGFKQTEIKNVIKDIVNNEIYT